MNSDFTDFTILPNAEALELRCQYAVEEADAAFLTRCIICLSIAGWGTVAAYLCFLLGMSSTF